MQNDNEAKMMRKRELCSCLSRMEEMDRERARARARIEISLVIECQQVAFGNWNNRIYM